MQLFTFMLLSFFLLIPTGCIQNCGPQGATADYVPSLDPRKSPEQNDHNDPTYSRKEQDDPFQETNEPLIVNVRYEPSKKVEKSTSTGEKKECAGQDNRRRGEFESGKDSGVKFRSQGQERVPSKPCKSDKLEVEKSEITCAKRKNVMNAECEQCELQVKANGDGVMLRCKDCREVPGSDIAFPPSSHRKVVRLP